MKLATVTHLAVVTTLLAFQGIANAQPTAAEEPAELRSPTAATLISLAGVAAPVAMVVAGADRGHDDLLVGGLALGVVGPSFGHWYAGKVITPGLVMRGAGGALALWGLAEAFDNACESCHEDSTHRGGDTAGLKFGVGVAAFVVGTVYDVATAGREARRYNERHGRLSVAPTVVSTGASQGMGVGFSGSF